MKQNGPSDFSDAPIEISMEPGEDDPTDADTTDWETHTWTGEQIYGFVLQNARQIVSVPTVLIAPCVSEEAWSWLIREHPFLSSPDFRVKPWMWIAIARRGMNYDPNADLPNSVVA